MKHQLIMENWRRFVNEERELTMLERYERALEESKNKPQMLEEGSIATAVLGMIMAFGGGEVNVNGMGITEKEAERAVLIIDGLDGDKYPEKEKAIEEIGEIFELAKGGETDFELNDGKGSSFQQGERGEPLALAALKKVDSMSGGSSSDTQPDTTDSGQTNFKITKGE